LAPWPSSHSCLNPAAPSTKNVTPAPAPSSVSKPADVPLWLLYPLFFAAIFLSHSTLMRLPYFWDEAGYYIPAAWDLFRTGTLIPQSTITNAHPPLPSILLAAWWHLSGFVIVGTRTFICMVSAAALLGVYNLSRKLAGSTVAAVTTFLTAIYPVWFAQSTLAHADIFAAAFTLWAFSAYLDPNGKTASRRRIDAAALFSLAALSKETAIVTPLALALWEAVQFFRNPASRRDHLRWAFTLIVPTLPLIGWYAYHYHHTGYVFGNPEFLRYNATANLSAYRILLSLWHRLLHLTVHMNMYVPVLCCIAAFFIPLTAKEFPQPAPRTVDRPTLEAIAVILLANLVAFSILGGALLTRYLLPMFPLILLVCVATWHRHLRQWWILAALSTVALLAGIWINPPYAFAPEDNLTYRDMIVLHQQAIRVLQQRFPQATVLTAWPASTELARPELGYTHTPFKVFAIQNFSIEQMQKAAADPAGYDTALIFSTKWEPPPGHINLGKPNQSADTRYFDFHHDLHPDEAARLLHGEIVWQAQRRGEWAAVLHFPRIVDAALLPLPRR
jgi:4-amino-4-deoxy-L-arabinose transferase-like glycosyltransferase